MKVFCRCEYLEQVEAFEKSEHDKKKAEVATFEIEFVLDIVWFFVFSCFCLLFSFFFLVSLYLSVWLRVTFITSECGNNCENAANVTVG